jgi:hypothetical protein
VFVWIRDGRIELSCPDGYDVSRPTVEQARRVEPALTSLADRVIEPPLDDPHCFCPKYYPGVPW